MHESFEGIRVLCVEELGYEAVFVKIGGETILMMDAVLDTDERMEIMSQALAQASE